MFALPNRRSDLDGDGIDDAVEQALAERFAPVVCMDPGEPNYPVNVEWFLARARLTYYEDCWPDVEEVPGAATLRHPEYPTLPTLGTVAQLLGPPWRHPFPDESLDRDCHCGSAPDHGPIATDEPAPERFPDQTTFVLPDLFGPDQLGSLQPADWTTYVHVYPAASDLVGASASLSCALKDPAEASDALLHGIVVQYWHLFAYDGYLFANAGHHGATGTPASTCSSLPGTVQAAERPGLPPLLRAVGLDLRHVGNASARAGVPGLPRRRLLLLVLARRRRAGRGRDAPLERASGGLGAGRARRASS